MRYFIFAIAVLCFGLGVFFMNRISGGKAIEDQVVAAVKTNEFMLKILGGPITKIQRSGGPSHVELSLDGSRNGFFSYLIAGTKTNGDFKIEWAQIPGGLEIENIFLRSPSQQDKLLWEQKLNGAVTNGDEQAPR